MKSPIHPGRVDWTGENPGIYLKDTQDGPWTGLMTFFRIVYSPHGLGHGVVVLDQPGVEKGPPEVQNFCITDNEPLARFLVTTTTSKHRVFVWLRTPTLPDHQLIVFAVVELSVVVGAP